MLKQVMKILGDDSSAACEGGKPRDIIARERRMKRTHEHNLNKINCEVSRGCGGYYRAKRIHEHNSINCNWEVSDVSRILIKFKCSLPRDCIAWLLESFLIFQR